MSSAMAIVIYFSNGPLQGKYTRYNGSRLYRYPVSRKFTCWPEEGLVVENLELEYRAQARPLFDDGQTVILEYKIEAWRV